jgi:hypothetical protein
MRRYFKSVTACVLFLLAVSLSAFAGSTKDVFSGAALVGTSGTVSGSFTFNTSTDQFSGFSLSFNGGVFAGATASNGGGQGTCYQGFCGFYFQGKASDGAWVTDMIVVNLKTGQFDDFGGIYNWQKQGGDFNYLSVPEGGAKLTYLMLSAIAVFGGILISGKQRRITQATHRS